MNVCLFPWHLRSITSKMAIAGDTGEDGSGQIESLNYGSRSEIDVGDNHLTDFILADIAGAKCINTK